MNTQLLEESIRWQGAGIVALPVRTDGSKAPGLTAWKEYQQRHPTIDELVQWFTGDTDGIGILTGTISGHLEMVELEGRAVEAGALSRLENYARDHASIELFNRLIDGYCERTPSGGIHILYRIDSGGVRKNTKLARTPDRHVLAETRGEGGFVVTAPSAGRTHETGNPWALITGSIENIATITIDERDHLWAIIRMLDEEPEREPATPHITTGILGPTTASTRPGDDYNERADWADILTGWTRSTRMGSGYGWRKPGKQKPGISATTGQSTDGIDRLYVFSTSTEFDPERPYNKFSAYTLLQHAGDYSAAATALAAAGYGSKATVRIPVMAGSSSVPDTVPDTFPPPIPAAHQEPGAPRTYTADTQDAHAIMLIVAQGERIRYCPELDKWLAWNSHVWKTQARDCGVVYEYAKEVARRLPEGIKEEARYKRSCLTSNGIAAALRLAQTDPAVRIHVDKLDADPWALNTPDGTINLATGHLHPADPKMHHTKSTIVAPDFNASQHQWIDFLSTTFAGNNEVIGWVQRIFGYACIGVVREHIFPVLYGQGANGKSVLLEVISRLLGDYAITLPPKFLTQNGQGVTDAASLIGVRLAVASETNEGESFDEALVKRLTGGDTVRARYMRQDWFQFTPSHTLVLATNHRLEVPSGGGNSFWRRIREVPFDHILAEEEQDAELPSKLINEHGPAIMAWLAQGAAKYAQHGLSDPAIVTKATKAYAESADHISQYLAARCTAYLGAREKVADLYRDYSHWCLTESIATKEFKGRRQFIEAMKRHGGESRKGTGGTYYVVGIRLLTDEERDQE